jgi:hypothetical protein
MEFYVAYFVVGLIAFAAIMYIVCDFVQYLFSGRRFVTPLRHLIEGLAFAVPALIEIVVNCSLLLGIPFIPFAGDPLSALSPALTKHPFAVRTKARFDRSGVYRHL